MIEQNKRTKTSKFIFPMFNILISGNFINCYLVYNDHQHDVPVIYYLTRFKEQLDCLETIEYSDRCVHILSIPEEYLDDYYKIIKGQYSKISDKLKENIRYTWGDRNEEYKVVTKHPERKKWLEELIGQELDSEAELMSIINIEQETLKIELEICKN